MLIEYPIVEKNTGAFANIGRQKLKEFTQFCFSLFKVSFKTARRGGIQGHVAFVCLSVDLTYRVIEKGGRDLKPL